MDEITISRQERLDLERDFPNLVRVRYTVTSAESGKYNCIACAAGDTNRFWWPRLGFYWPRSAPRTEAVESFIEMFRGLGYEPCTSRKLEAGFEKVAIYAENMVPKHAARQLPDGEWIS